MPTWDEVPEELKKMFRPPPDRQDFGSEEEYEDARGYWQSHVGRNIGLAMQQRANAQRDGGPAKPQHDIESLLAYVKADRRVCPMPIYWDKMFRLLPNRQRTNAGRVPPNPLILGGWWASSNSDKRERLVDHIRWAAAHGALEEVGIYLRALHPEHWHYEET